MDLLVLGTNVCIDENWLVALSTATMLAATWESRYSSSQQADGEQILGLHCQTSVRHNVL